MQLSTPYNNNRHYPATVCAAPTQAHTLAYIYTPIQVQWSFYLLFVFVVLTEFGFCVLYIIDVA